MDDDTRHQRIALRFLVSLAEQFGRDAPAALRAMADDLDRVLGPAWSWEVAGQGRNSLSRRDRSA